MELRSSSERVLTVGCSCEFSDGFAIRLVKSSDSAVSVWMKRRGFVVPPLKSPDSAVLCILMDGRLMTPYWMSSENAESLTISICSWGLCAGRVVSDQCQFTRTWILDITST